MRKKKISIVSVILIIILSFSGGFLTNTVVRSLLYTKGLSIEQIGLINTVNQIIADEAIEDHDKNDLVDYALKGMAAALEDDYAYYYTKDEVEEYMKSTTGTVEGGIGVSLFNDNGTFVISEIYKGLSADAAGIKAGDVLIEVNGENIEDISFNEVPNKVKGEPGTEVKIGVMRNGKKLSFNVQRTTGQRELTEYKMIDSLLYVKIISFHGNAAECFEEALKYGEKNNYNGIIIDLRNNPGGELSIFVDIADRLLKEGEVFYAMDKKGNKISVEKSDENSVNKPLCVLINEHSASASEAMAGALRDLGNAEIVGTKSFGKGIMQTSYTLKNGGMFKLTTAKYYLPNGDCIHEKGITPEHIVELPQNLKEKYWQLNEANDTQLKKAIELLTK